MSAQQPIQQPVGEQKAPEPAKPSNRVYCRWEVTDDTLKDMFAKYGKVVESRVVRGPRLRAFGFVTFENEAEAAKAISQLNGQSLSSPMTLEYAASGPRARAPRVKKEKAPVAAPVDGVTGQAAPQQSHKRGPKPQTTAAGAGTEGAPAPRRRRNRRAAEQKDPNWGKVVALIPNPIRSPLPADAKIIELQAGQRQYRPGYTSGKVISSLILNADPSKGPFNCDFRLGEFDLKLLSVKVNSKPGDCRIGARIMSVATQRSREVYLRVRANGENRHKFFELIKPGTDVTAPQHEVYFVGIDSIQLEAESGLWKKIVFSLVSAVVPQRVPKAALEAAGAQPVVGGPAAPTS